MGIWFGKTYSQGNEAIEIALDRAIIKIKRIFSRYSGLNKKNRLS